MAAPVERDGRSPRARERPETIRGVPKECAGDICVELESSRGRGIHNCRAGIDDGLEATDGGPPVHERGSVADLPETAVGREWMRLNGADVEARISSAKVEL